MTLLAPTYRQRRGGRQRAVAPGYGLDPYREMEDINNRFSQLIQTFFGAAAEPAGMARWSPFTPPVDVEETDDAYIVDVDLPNVNPEDVTIEMRGEELRISGQFQQREHTGVVRRQNRQAGDFEYVVDLPSDIDPNRVDAMYDNGVLTVTVGKAQDAQPRRIEIRGLQGNRQIGQSDRQQAAGRSGQRDKQQGMQAEERQATARQGQQTAARQGSGMS